MTDFFAQLAARYRGDADVLRPRVPFRFEPVSASLAAADLPGRRGPRSPAGRWLRRIRSGRLRRRRAGRTRRAR